CVRESALRDGLFHQPAQLGLGHRDLEPRALGRVIQAIEVLVQPEHAPVIHADSLEHAVAVQETVIEHRDLGVRLVVVLAVDPDRGCHGSGAEYTAGKEKSATCALRHRVLVVAAAPRADWESSRNYTRDAR